MGITVTGKLKYGYTDDAGTAHADFEMRMPTLEDMECVIEALPEDASAARIKRYLWARTMVRLGTLPPEAITPELLAGLHCTEYEALQDSESELTGKLAPVSAA